MIETAYIILFIASIIAGYLCGRFCLTGAAIGRKLKILVVVEFVVLCFVSLTTWFAPHFPKFDLLLLFFGAAHVFMAFGYFESWYEMKAKS